MAFLLAGHAAAAHEPPPDLAAIVAPLLPAVVNLTVWGPSDAGTPLGPDGVRPSQALFFGSGFVIDPAGIIVTNEHVVHDAFSVTVHFSDGTTTPGKVLATGGTVDLAVVKVEVPHPLTALAFGDSSALRVGDTVMAIGNPLGVGLSLSAGVVSALNRNVADDPYAEFIQTDASINHGNSGGPLVDLQGKVVGVDSSLITFAGAGSIGLGLSIPSNDAKLVVGRLLKDGELRLGWTGALLQDVGPDMTAALHLPQHDAAIIAAIVPGSPAATAGLREGDIVLGIDGRPAADSRALERQVAEAEIGKNVAMSVWRSRQTMTIPVMIAAYPGSGGPGSGGPGSGGKVTIPAQADASAGNLGLHVAAITPALRGRYGLDPTLTGLVVTAIDAGSPASRQGLAPGDVILRAMDAPVSAPGEVEKAEAEARQDNLPAFPILVRSGTAQRWVTISD